MTNNYLRLNSDESETLLLVGSNSRVIVYVVLTTISFLFFTFASCNKFNMFVLFCYSLCMYLFYF